MNNKDDFLKAIDGKFKIRITFDSIEKGIITRTCIPFDFGPSQKEDVIDKSDKYHVLSLGTPKPKPHPIPITEDKMMEVEVLDETFDPTTYVKWQTNWIYSRDWGDKS